MYDFAIVCVISAASAFLGALVGALVARIFLMDDVASVRRVWAGDAIVQFESFIHSWNEVSEFEWWHPLSPLPPELKIDPSAQAVDRWLNAHAVLLWADTKRFLDQADGPIVEIPLAITEKEHQVESKLMKWAKHGRTPRSSWFMSELTRMAPRIKALSGHDGSFYGFPGFVPTGTRPSQ